MVGVQDVMAGPAGPVRIVGTGPLLARVAHALVDRGIESLDLRADLPTLEDAYIALTGDEPETDREAR